MIVWILLFQGAIFSSAWGCGLEDVCRADGINNRTVDPLSVPVPQVSATCSGPDASSSSWFIRRYMNGNDSLDGLGALLTLNDSFRQNGNELTIRKVNGFAEGTYHCGVDNDTIQPASLCLFVQGRPFFECCPDKFEVCPRILQIAGTPNGNVSIDTRISFTDGGFCKMTQRIRHLEITKLNEENEKQDSVYFCPNLRHFSSQLCNSSGKFRVEQQQTCIEPDITSCKYDMKLVLWNFNESDEGIYNITVAIDNLNHGREILRQQFNLSKSNDSTTSSTTTFNTTLPTTTDVGIKIGVGLGVLALIIVIIIIIAVCLWRNKRKEQDEVDGGVFHTIKVKCPGMLTLTDDKIVIVGDSVNQVNIYSKEGKEIKSFKLEGKSKPKPRGVSTDGEYLFITDKSNQSVAKYNFDGTCIKLSDGKNRTEPLEFNGCCGISTCIKMKRVYIADECNHRIQVLDLNLKPFFKFGTRGSKKKEFESPCDVAVTNDGTVYVTDTGNNRVQVFKADGEYIREFGNDTLGSPVGICIDDDGRILVADHGNCRVCVFNPNGELIDSFGENEKKKAEFVDLYGIAVDSNGKIYTADYGNHCVQVFH